MLLKVVQRLLTSEHALVPQLARLVTTKWLLHFVRAALPASVVATAVRLVAVQCHRTGRAGHSGFASEFVRARGLAVLRAVLPHFCLDADVYYAVLALALGTDVRLIPEAPSFAVQELFATFKVDPLKLAMPGALPVFFDMLRQTFIVISRTATPPPVDAATSPRHQQQQHSQQGQQQQQAQAQVQKVQQYGTIHLFLYAGGRLF